MDLLCAVRSCSFFLFYFTISCGCIAYFLIFMQNKDMNIATALNRKYVKYAAVMLTSVCESNAEHVDAYLLHTELTDADIAALREALSAYDIRICPLKVEADRIDQRLPRSESWSVEMYFRLLLPELLPESVERILYLDVDMIVNRSVRALYETDFSATAHQNNTNGGILLKNMPLPAGGEYEIIGALDSNGIFTEADYTEKQLTMLAPLFASGRYYFNSGMMLMNIAAIRKRCTFQTYLDAAKRWRYEMRAPDQDLLNDVHWERTGYVDWKLYDLFAGHAHTDGATYEEVKENAAIIHFSGNKPWNADFFHYDIQQLWWDYAKKTPFYHALLEELLHKMLFDPSLERSIEASVRKNNELQGLIDRLTEVNRKLMDALGLS